MSTKALSSFALALLVGACAAPPIVGEDRAVPSAWPAEPDPLDYSGSPSLLSGFSATSPAQWNRKDTSLFALEWHADSDPVQRLLLELQVIEPRHMQQGPNGPVPEITSVELEVHGETWSMQSEQAAMRVRVFEADGTWSGESTVRVPVTALNHGFAAACRLAEETGEGVLDGEPVDPTYLEAVTSLLALAGIIQNDPILADILWDVVQSPSVWSVVSNFGVSVALTPYFSRCERVTSRPPHLPHGHPAWALPIILEVNGTPALAADLLVTEPAPPLHLCGGIVGIRAFHPEDPDLWFRMVLLSSTTNN